MRGGLGGAAGQNGAGGEIPSAAFVLSPRYFLNKIQIVSSPLSPML